MDCNRQAYFLVNNRLCCLDSAACIAAISKSSELAEVVWKHNCSHKKSGVKQEKAEEGGGGKPDRKK